MGEGERGVEGWRDLSLKKKKVVEETSSNLSMSESESVEVVV